jgi:hypothetical protein
MTCASPFFIFLFISSMVRVFWFGLSFVSSVYADLGVTQVLMFFQNQTQYAPTLQKREKKGTIKSIKVYRFERLAKRGAYEFASCAFSTHVFSCITTLPRKLFF